jgi:tetratricopeptide (TPR) repeat protein
LWGNVLYQVNINDNVACGGVQTVVAKPDWDVFENIFRASGILEMKPYLPRKSFRHRWDDALERQILPSDWRIYQLKGVDKWRKGDLEGAERFYDKAESFQPETDEFYIHLSEFYDGIGDQARAQENFRKALKYRLFPPPDYIPPGKR